MGFLMDGLDAEAYDRKYTDRALVGRIATYFRSKLHLMIFVAVLVVLSSLADTAFPLLVARGLDVLIASPNLQVISELIVVILIAGILSWIFNFFRQRNTARAVGHVVLNLREDAFEAVMARDMSFYDSFSSGKIVS
ncbi:MAG: ABC transporter transmembrane domain-containing protein, partial [Ktedonobacteraceae bacterium]